jgi:hypothetical protein
LAYIIPSSQIICSTRWRKRSCRRRSTVMRPASPTPWRVQGNGAAPAFPSWFVTCVCQLPSDGESTNKNHYVPLQFLLSTSEDLLGSRVDPDRRSRPGSCLSLLYLQLFPHQIGSCFHTLFLHLAGDIATASETPGTSPAYQAHWEPRGRPRFPHRQQ